MADIEPFPRPPLRPRARRGPARPVVAPPYDVIDADRARELVARSPYNVVEIDLPEAGDGGDPYAHAAEMLARWREQGVVVRDDEPALWALEQDYTGPDGRRAARATGSSRACAWRTTAPGRIRPHERTHPGPEGGPPAAHAGDAGQPLADLQPLRRPRRARRGARSSRTPPASRSATSPTTTARATGSGGSATPTRSRPSRDALEGDRAADRRRPPPLRDRPRLRRGDRRRGRAPLRAHVPRRAQDPGLTVFPTHRLLVGLDDDRRRGARTTSSSATGTIERRRRRRARAAPATARSALGYLEAGQPPACSRCATRRSPTPRCPATPSPTGASTPRCSRRSCSRARST